MNKNLEYVVLFIVGGISIVVTKYLTNEVSPKLGAILATIPIGLFSAYFIVEEDKVPDYLENYLMQTIFIVVSTVLYLYLLNNQDLKHRTVYLMILSLWIVFIISQLLK